MRTSMKVISILVVAGALAGCASMKSARKSESELDQLRSQVEGLENRLNTMTASQASLQHELQSVTGMQQNLRQQLDALAQQRQKAAVKTVDEK